MTKRTEKTRGTQAANREATSFGEAARSARRRDDDHAPELQLLHRWLDTCNGIGLISAGMHRTGWDLHRLRHRPLAGDVLGDWGGALDHGWVSVRDDGVAGGAGGGVADAEQGGPTMIQPGRRISLVVALLLAVALPLMPSSGYADHERFIVGEIRDVDPSAKGITSGLWHLRTEP